MAKRKRATCKRGEKRFTVIRVRGDDLDSHAGRSFERAMELAMPDRGNRVDVFTVCAPNGGVARMPSVYKRGVLARSFKYKRGG